MAAERERQKNLLAQRRQEAAQAEQSRREDSRQARELQRYSNALQSAVTRSWRKPKGVSSGIQCVVNVTQETNGRVRDVRVEDCSAGGELMRASVEQAVLRASPLPTPNDASLFDRNLRIRFKF